jgi:catechol 2,3-dioxygenase-like lactoylglutathione lyase family enzyme
MAVALTKDSIGLGIITTNAEKALAFYRDTLGFEYEGEMAMPGGAKMHRLLCGTSTIKLVAPAREPKATAPPGGLLGATGYRYWTISVSNLEAMVEKCSADGYKVAVPPNEIRPGVTIAIVEDPDGNWVEFLQQG